MVLVLICHCEGVRAEEIRTVVRVGARSVDDVTVACGAGGRCGGCLPAVADIVERELSCLLVASSPAA